MTGAIRALELYDPNNDMVRRLFEQITGVVEMQVQRGRAAVVLQIEGENCFINQTLLRLDLKSFKRLDRLRHLLQRLDLNEIEFRQGVTPATLTVFFSHLSQASSSPESRNNTSPTAAAAAPTPMQTSAPRAKLCISCWFARLSS